MTRLQFDSSEDLLAFVKTMAHHLSELGFDEAMVELTDWCSTSFTTSSEFLGELGFVCRRIIERDGARLPPCCREDIEACLAESRAAFPKNRMIRWLSLITVLSLTVHGCQSIPQPTIASHGMPRERKSNDGAPMMLVPAGEFTMGFSDELIREEPTHRVYLDAFYMDKYEVTVRRYATFLKATGRKEPDFWSQRSQVSAEKLPVIGVDWYDADVYCRHYGKRLPTEHEWEKAARGTDGRTYPWGSEEPSGRYANYAGKGALDPIPGNWYSGLKEVGSYEDGQSPYGIYDLAGNVWEWTSSANDPADPVAVKVVRGGFWHDAPRNLRSATVNFVEPSSRATVGGFRCVQDTK